jgi:hypothetical protein
MQATRNLLAVAASIALVACGGGGSDKDGGGGTPTPFQPEITGITLNNATIDVGANQKTTLTVALVAGASATSVSYLLQKIPMGGLQRTDEPTVSNAYQFPTNAYFSNGSWTAMHLEVKTATHRYRFQQYGSDATYAGPEVADLAGNPVTNVATVAPFPVIAFTVTNATAETTPPVVTRVAASGTGTGLAGAFLPGDTVTIEVDATDAQAGIDGVWAGLRQKSAHAAARYPEQSVPSQMLAYGMKLVSGSTYRGQVTIGSGMNVRPNDLYVFATVDDVRGNSMALTFDDAISTTKYAANSAVSTLDLALVDFAYTWPPAVIANGSTPLTPSSTDNNFSIGLDATVVHSYNVTASTLYSFLLGTNDASSGAYTAKKVIVGLYYADGTVQEEGSVLSTRDFLTNFSPTNVGSSTTQFTASRTGVLYVVTRCNSGDGCTPGTMSHRIE